MITQVNEGFVFADNYARKDRQQDLEWKRQLEQAGLQLEEFESRLSYDDPSSGTQSLKVDVSNQIGEFVEEDGRQLASEFINGRVNSDLHSGSQGTKETIPGRKIQNLVQVHSISESMGRQSREVRIQEPLMKAINLITEEGVKYRQFHFSFIEKNGAKVMAVRDYFSEPEVVLRWVENFLFEVDTTEQPVKEVIINGVSYAVVNNELMRLEE